MEALLVQPGPTFLNPFLVLKNWSKSLQHYQTFHINHFKSVSKLSRGVKKEEKNCRKAIKVPWAAYDKLLHFET